MRARSWMAALALIAGISIAVQRALPAQGPSPAPQPAPARVPDPAGPDASTNPTPKAPGTDWPAVQLNLIIAGLGRGGCRVEVKPGNASCKFRAFRPGRVAADAKAKPKGPSVEQGGSDNTLPVPSDGHATIELRDIELRDADHTLTVAITVHEQGQPAKTIYRGFRLNPRLAASGAATSVPAFTCYLSSPSRVARLDESRIRR